MACDLHMYGNKAFCMLSCKKAGMYVVETNVPFSQQNRSASSQIMIKEACKGLAMPYFRVHQCSF